jgi:hypothetical protein
VNRAFEKIYVRHLDASVDADTLCEVFAPFGTITSAQVCSSNERFLYWQGGIMHIDIALPVMPYLYLGII